MMKDVDGERTAHDCPDCGDCLRRAVEVSDGTEIELECEGCGDRFRGVEEQHDGALSLRLVCRA